MVSVCSVDVAVELDVVPVVVDSVVVVFVHLLNSDRSVVVLPGARNPVSSSGTEGVQPCKDHAMAARRTAIQEPPTSLIPAGCSVRHWQRWSGTKARGGAEPKE
jgi:hypothetical protein